MKFSIRQISLRLPTLLLCVLLYQTGYGVVALPSSSLALDCGSDCDKLSKETIPTFGRGLRRSARAVISFCTVPPQPENGERKLHSYSCNSRDNCDVRQGTTLDPGSQLVYSCLTGYTLKGTSNVYCGNDGNWSEIPVCEETTCVALNSSSTTASCSRLGETVSCETKVLPKTIARMKCRDGYTENANPVASDKDWIVCNADGKWDLEPVTCEATRKKKKREACGVAPSEQTSFVFNGVSVNITDFPWQASVYGETTVEGVVTNKFLCISNVIHEKFVLTVGHCVQRYESNTTLDPKTVYVTTGNVFRDDNPPVSDLHAVKRIYAHERYSGPDTNYVADIALLELTEPLEFSSLLMPVCLRYFESTDKIFEPGVLGKVAGFGTPDLISARSILRTLTVPHVPYEQCRKNTRRPELLGVDKFCAGWSNATDVCVGDSGSGLVVKKNNLWYIAGLVSISILRDLPTPGCDPQAYTAYTDVSQYYSWIQNVIENAEPDAR